MGGRGGWFSVFLFLRALKEVLHPELKYSATSRHSLHDCIVCSFFLAFHIFLKPISFFLFIPFLSQSKLMK